MNNLSFDDLLELIVKWNIDFPIDRWWRKTHSVAFNSKHHREVTFIDMFIEFEEDSLFEELRKSDKSYTPNTGTYLKKQKVDDTITDESFNNIDLDNI